MAKRKKFKNKKVSVKNQKTKKLSRFALPEETRRWTFGVLMFLIALIISLSFFDLAGIAGKATLKWFIFLFGKAIFIIPLFFITAGIISLETKHRKILSLAIIAIFILILGISGILGILSSGQREISLPLPQGSGQGGWLGYVLAWPLVKLFGFWVTLLVFSAIILIGGLIFFYPLYSKREQEKEIAKAAKEPARPSIIKKIFSPKFEVKKIEPAPFPVKPSLPETSIKTSASSIFAKERFISGKPARIASGVSGYQFPPLNLLEKERDRPTSGDIETSRVIIKRTLQNFGIPVEMSEVNVGPTVTQYTLKPAEGVKLSKIIGLSNNLSLALASHPIRIEAPIPGRSLVGIEVPNKGRASVRLRDLFKNPVFQNSISSLTLALGRDVSGSPVYTDLARMPHLLVAGSTGTGKTICLNSIILSLLYQNDPGILRFILIDPKRVEFTIYDGLPHLLAPVILDTQKAINALKWLIEEMERRFRILAAQKSKNIISYNEKILKQGLEPLPYIVLVIDELADLMAARSREIEGEIVRLAQMARAVGIHLIVATQRPSVEVITGLIKANITSRITFQVASQVDSRTILDVAGAEKLLGSGDMLFISAETPKPKRIQGAYVSEKETKGVVNYIKSKTKDSALAESFADKQKTEDEKGIQENGLARDLEKTLEAPQSDFESFYGGEEPLYEEAKRVVIESKKASASLLQRRLRVGYARAARLIDMLEEKGVVGPGEGAKPREVYIEEVRNDENF